MLCSVKSQDTHTLNNTNNQIKPEPNQVPIRFKHRGFFRSDRTRLNEQPGFYRHCFFADSEDRAQEHREEP